MSCYYTFVIGTLPNFTCSYGLNVIYVPWIIVYYKYFNTGLYLITIYQQFVYFKISYGIYIR